MTSVRAPFESEPLPEGLSAITSIDQMDEETKRTVFAQIAELSHTENDHGFMFSVSPETAERSLTDPLCGGMILISEVDGHVVVAGYAKIMPLSHHATLDLPPVYEFGGLVVNPEFRGHKLSEYLIRRLTTEFIEKREEIAQEAPLIIATTKNAAAKRAFERTWEYVGKFRGFPAMMALTCTCNPPFGNGMHVANLDNGGLCQFRTDDDAMHKPDSIPCHLCINNRELAESYNRAIMEQYAAHAHPVAHLVNDLKTAEHYD